MVRTGTSKISGTVSTLSLLVVLIGTVRYQKKKINLYVVPYCQVLIGTVRYGPVQAGTDVFEPGRN